MKNTDRLGNKMLRNCSREDIASTVAAFVFASGQRSPFFLGFRSILSVNCEFKKAKIISYMFQFQQMREQELMKR